MQPQARVDRDIDRLTDRYAADVVGVAQRQSRNNTPHYRKPNMPYNKIAAILVWCFGVFTTYLFLATIDDRLAVIVPGAFLVQGLLTVYERPTWRGRHSMVSGVAVVLDMAINAGGIYPNMLRVGNTPTAQMFAHALGLNQDISPVAALVLSLLLGFFLAAGPEAAWRWED